MIFIWQLIVLLESYRHKVVISRLKRSPNKAVSFCVRLAIASALMWFEFPGVRPWYVVGPAYLFMGWMHDYILNIMRWKDLKKGTPIWDLNDTGPLDRFQNNFLGADIWFFWKVLLYFGFLAVYIFNYPPFS